MRSAPPVVFPVGRSVWGPRTGLALAALSAWAVFGLWQGSAEVGWSVFSAGPWWGGLLAWTLAALLSWRLWTREALPPGELRWDSEDWTYQGSDGLPQPVHLVALWDIGPAILVELSFQGHQPWACRRFAWLTRGQMPGLWHACRCAIFGRDIL